MGSSSLQYLCFASMLVNSVLLVQYVAGNEKNSLLKFQHNSRDICDEANCKSAELRKHLISTLNYVEYNFTYEVYTAAIKDIQDSQPAYILVEDLWSTYEKGDSRSFLTMVRAQLALYSLQQNQNKNIDTKYLLKAAYCFRKIQHDPLYTCLNANDRNNLEEAIKSLPTSLDYIFFKNKFCLLNKLYSEVLYQAGIDVNKTTRYAFTWSGEISVVQEKGCITPIFLESEDDNTLNVNVDMYGEFYKSLYYRNAALGNLIVTNKTQQVLDNSIWMMHLFDEENIILQQNGYTLCATTNYNTQRRFVYGLPSIQDIGNNCLWSPGECDRKSLNSV